MKFLLDNDIPFKIAHALTALGEPVEALRDVYGADAQDADWIPKAAAEKYVVVTADRKMLRGSAEKEALRKYKLTVLFLQPFFANLRMWDKAVWFIRKWESIRNFGTSASKGTLAKIGHQGRCTVTPLK